MFASEVGARIYYDISYHIIIISYNSHSNDIMILYCIMKALWLRRPTEQFCHQSHSINNLAATTAPATQPMPLLPLPNQLLLGKVGILLLHLSGSRVDAFPASSLLLSHLRHYRIDVRPSDCQTVEPSVFASLVFRPNH